MNRLIIIGNGFDLAHGLKTSYHDFILHYLKDTEHPNLGHITGIHRLMESDYLWMDRSGWVWTIFHQRQIRWDIRYK